VDLPLYVSETERAPEAPHHVPTWLRASANAVEVVVEGLGRRAPAVDRLVLLPTTRAEPVVMLVIGRLVLLRPRAATSAFDAWRSTTEQVVSGKSGRLLLDNRVTATKPTRLRAVEARLFLARLTAPVPVELELSAWDPWHTILSLRLTRRIRRMAGSRRSRYFRGGHAVLDDIRDHLEDRADGSNSE
jgi:hypothetical protein